MAQVCKELGLTLELSTPRRGSLAGSALLCEGKTLPGLIGSEAVFEGLRANLQKNRTLVWRCCLRSVFFQAPRYFASARIL